VVDAYSAGEAPPLFAPDPAEPPEPVGAWTWPSEI